MDKKELDELLRSGDPEALAEGVNQLLAEDFSSLAAKALAKLASIDPTLAVRVAATFLDRTSDRVARAEVATILVPIPTRESKALLDKLALDDDPNTRASTVRFLAPTPRDLKRLTLLLADRRSMVAVSAAASLAGLGDAAVPALSQGLKDPRVGVQRVSAKALARIGDESAIEALEEAIRQAHYPWKLSLMLQRKKLIKSRSRDLP